MSQGSDYRRTLVVSQFHRARRRAALETLLARLSGQPANLLSFDDVVGKLGISGQSSIGVQQVAIDDIVGSVGRYQDFTRTFLPRLESDEDRWVNVGAAARLVTDLPPVELYKVGKSYFVLDGNHRISLARQQQIDYIDAKVIEVRTRVPLPAGANPDQLIIAAEHGAFLAYTRLDILRPGSEMQVSVPGQYRRLENHIEANRFILETKEERELTYDEAVTRWYDDVYLPMVHAIREQGILRYFPSRTETDFFVWLARHRADLQNELGYTITPDVAVARLLSKVQAAGVGRQDTLASRIRRLTRLSPPETSGVAPHLTWAQERTLGRYSDHLFSSVLFPFVIREENGQMGPTQEMLARGLDLAEEEQARFCALCIIEHDEPTPGESAVIADVKHWLEGHPTQAEVLIESGHALRWTEDVGFLHDLIIVERSFDRQTPREKSPTVTVGTLIREVRRPILILGESTGPSIPQRVLVVHDTRRSHDEAIFITAYLAEQWRVELVILPLSNGRNTEEIVARIDQYLALHEVTATFLDPVRPNERAATHIIDAATSGNYDLLVMTGPDGGRKNIRTNYTTDIIWAVLQRWPRSLLVAT